MRQKKDLAIRALAYSGEDVMIVAIAVRLFSFPA
jgi:hypothetical protein